MRLYITKWLERPDTLQFRKMARDYENFLGAGIDLQLAIHGGGPITKTCDELYAKGCEVFDLRGPHYDGRQPRIVKRILEQCLLENVNYFGVLDDDSFIRDPDVFHQRAMECFNRGAVATGPYLDYIHWVRHKNSEEYIHEPKEKDLGTPGCQLYEYKFILQMLPLWKDVLEDSHWLTDTQFTIMARNYSYKLLRFNAPGYQHPGSSGTAGKVDLPWFIRRMEAIYQDYSAYVKFLDRLGGGARDRFRALIEFDFDRTYRYTVKMVTQKGDSSTWGFSPEKVSLFEAFEWCELPFLERI